MTIIIVIITYYKWDWDLSNVISANVIETIYHEMWVIHKIVSYIFITFIVRTPKLSLDRLGTNCYPLHCWSLQSNRLGRCIDESSIRLSMKSLLQKTPNHSLGSLDMIASRASYLFGAGNGYHVMPYRSLSLIR